MSWDKFSEGASKGFDEFMEVLDGKSIQDAMADIKEHFEEQE